MSPSRWYRYCNQIWQFLRSLPSTLFLGQFVPALQICHLLSFSADGNNFYWFLLPCQTIFRFLVTVFVVIILAQVLVWNNAAYIATAVIIITLDMWLHNKSVVPHTHGYMQDWRGEAYLSPMSWCTHIYLTHKH